MPPEKPVERLREYPCGHVAVGGPECEHCREDAAMDARRNMDDCFEVGSEWSNIEDEAARDSMRIERYDSLSDF